MQIKFNHIQFTQIEYKANTYDKSITNELETSLGIKSMFSDEKKNDFAISFDLLLKNKSKEFKLKLTAIAHFSTSDEIDSDFRQSPFIEVNAPAIAFPYVRTFISNLTLNSGYDPIVLPAFNFVQLAEAKAKRLS